MLAFRLISEALDVSQEEGKTRWHQAQQRLQRRSLQLPPFERVKVPGAPRHRTPQLAANDAAKALRLVLKQPLEEFFNKEEKLEWLRRKVAEAGGDAATVDVELAQMLEEKAQAEADAQSLVLPGLQSSAQMSLRTLRQDGEVLGSVLDFLRWLALDGKSEWNNWLRDKFRQSVTVFGENPGETLGEQVGGRIVYSEKHLAQQSMPTPFTNFAGFRLLTKLCLHKSKIAQAMYDQALLVLGRVSVGDQRLHATLDANAAEASEPARAFVLGANEARAQTQCSGKKRNADVDVDVFEMACAEGDVIHVDGCQRTHDTSLRSAHLPLSLTDAAGRAMFKELVKTRCPDCSGRTLKALTLRAYYEFVRLIAQDEQRSEAAVRVELASNLGTHVEVPQKWTALAQAAVELVFAPEGPMVAGGPASSSTSASKARGQRRTTPGPFVAEADHGVAKDAANAMWIQRLRPGAALFFLDSWTAGTGLALRTTQALKRAGFTSQLHSANPDASICAQLRNEGVEAFEGSWEQMPAGVRFDGIYLDLCSGSEAYLRRQLELATSRAAPACTLAWTLTERDFNGEPLTIRLMRLDEFLQDMGWQPALHRISASTLIHRSGGGQQVVTQLWQGR